MKPTNQPTYQPTNHPTTQPTNQSAHNIPGDLYSPSLTFSKEIRTLSNLLIEAKIKEEKSGELEGILRSIDPPLDSVLPVGGHGLTSRAMTSRLFGSGQRGRHSSLVVFGLAVLLHGNVVGSILLSGLFSSRGDFPHGVNMSSDSIPPKTRLDESINLGLICPHMHTKDPYIHALDA